MEKDFHAWRKADCVSQGAKEVSAAVVVSLKGASGISRGLLRLSTLVRYGLISYQNARSLCILGGQLRWSAVIRPFEGEEKAGERRCACA